MLLDIIGIILITMLVVGVYKVGIQILIEDFKDLWRSVKLFKYLYLEK